MGIDVQGINFMWQGLMKVIRRYRGRLGEIVIWENQTNGSRFYFEGNIFQSHSCPAGDSQFTYVKMMAEFLNKASKVLVLGCGGGNLATMLARAGQYVTVVDHNATSFAIAREYFGMPADIPCITDDFRRYLLAERPGNSMVLGSTLADQDSALKSSSISQPADRSRSGLRQAAGLS